MRRSISVVEPGFALAGQVANWRFLYTTAVSLPKGAILKFDLKLEQKPSDWEVPSVDLTEGKNVIWMFLPSEKIVKATEDISPLPAFIFTLPEEVHAGETLEIIMGCPKGKEGQTACGNRAQTLIQRRRSFHLYIDPKGNGDYKDPEVFNLDVRGNILHHLSLFVPSIVSKNRRFDILIRFEDLYGNLTHFAPEGTLIELSYENFRENLSWKLFVPETGFIVLPNLYFNEQGIYRVVLKSSTQKQEFVSSPIKCFAENDYSLYWTQLHGESPKIDSKEHIEAFLRHLRDEVGLQCVATSCFESSEETSSDEWKLISNQIAEYNEDDRFTTFLGMQRLGDANEGNRLLLHCKDQKPLLRKKETKYSELKKIYKSHSSKELLSIPTFTMARGYPGDFKEYDKEFERVVEIYNAWGSSECLAKEGNPRPITGHIEEHAMGSIRAALNRGCRFGFVAGGYDDRGCYEGLFESQQKQYSPGLTAILAIEHTRDSLFHALYHRSCYATTGAKIVLDFQVAQHRMGSELKTKIKPGLAFNRHISGFACGTEQIKEVILIRNGKPIHTFSPKNTSYFEFTYDDTDPIQDVVLDSSDESPPFVYYYVRIEQVDEHLAWSSPIWIDFEESLSVTSSFSTKKLKKKS